jgi:alanine racemase
VQPELSLDLDIVVANARAWRARAGVPLYAVLKANGYGWGISGLARALEPIADAFCVSDADELVELRRYSNKRAIILGSVEPDRLAQVLQSNALPSIASEMEFEVACSVLAQMTQELNVRLGLRPAAGFSGCSLAQLRAFAPVLAAAQARVELWSHITDWHRRAEQLQNFEHAVTVLRELGVQLEATDIASTFPLAADGPNGSAVRVGIGLFGATGGPSVEGVRCALRVIAPMVQTERHSAGTSVGYGGTMLRMEETIITARCGYADGLPNGLAGASDILSVGMQYVTVRAAGQNASRSANGDAEVVLLDESTNLDAFAAHAGRLPHEIVTAFGNCARANGVSVEV